jgi:hypothetical protein
VWRRRAVLIAMLAGCGDGDRMPTCEEVGCGAAASGTPDDWTPCNGSACWCDVPRGPIRSTADLYRPLTWYECSRVPCAGADPLCPSARHAEYGEYFIDGVRGRTCFCSPD